MQPAMPSDLPLEYMTGGHELYIEGRAADIGARTRREDTAQDQVTPRLGRAAEVELAKNQLGANVRSKRLSHEGRLLSRGLSAGRWKLRKRCSKGEPVWPCGVQMPVIAGDVSTWMECSGRVPPSL